MSVAEVVTRRRIAEVVHFTTNRGLIGILASKTLLPRKSLPEDKYVEHVYHPNCEYRRDPLWIGYNNLSVSRINTEFYDVSSGKWHRQKDVWWCVLAFDPEILTHDGVVFATTNNMYSGVRRASGEVGLESMFAQRIHRFAQTYVARPEGLADRFPTCVQAEVLYPGPLSTSYLRNVYVATEEHYDTAYGQCRVLGYRDVTVILQPAAFQ